MLAITFGLLLVWASMTAAGRAPVGRFLRRHLIERPALGLQRINRGHILLACVLLAVGSAIVWSGGGDGLRVLAMGAPDATAWLTTFEIGTYLDVLAGLAAAASVMRIRPMVTSLRGGWNRIRRVPGRPRDRTRRVRRHREEAANDDGDGHGTEIAA